MSSVRYEWCRIDIVDQPFWSHERCQFTKVAKVLTAIDQGKSIKNEMIDAVLEESDVATEECY